MENLVLAEVRGDEEKLFVYITNFCCCFVVIHLNYNSGIS